MAKPFLKFPGGKRSLLPILEKYVPKKFGHYFEPFLGGGALFFHLETIGRIKYNITLSDVCGPLIRTYFSVLGNCYNLIEELRDHRDEYFKGPEEYYYYVREDANSQGFGPSEFIFLNRTCFNGLFRLNKGGEFNVPIGRYKNPNICDEPGLLACSAALQNTKIYHCDFSYHLSSSKAGDFFYLDPPYVPIRPSSFTQYGSEFTMLDQERLASFVEALAKKGVHVLLSNSDTPWVKERYRDFEQVVIEAPRRIAAQTKDRDPVKERLIIVNG